jgi:hypothetical protein
VQGKTALTKLSKENQMRRGIAGGELVGSGAAKGRKIGDSKAKDNKRHRTTLAAHKQRSRHFRKRLIAKQKAAAISDTTPQAEPTMSFTSSCGLSQKSKLWHTGPERYQPSHNRTKSLMPRRFICL